MFQAQPEDAEAIAWIQIRSWRIAYQHIIHRSYLDDELNLDRQQELWEARLGGKEREGIFIARKNGHIAGFAFYGSSRNMKEEQLEDHAELYAIYVEPDFFGEGIGKRLLLACGQAAVDRGFEAMFVGVLADNYRGRGFYEHMGAQLMADSEEEQLVGGKTYLEVKYEWKSLKSNLLFPVRKIPLLG